MSQFVNNSANKSNQFGRHSSVSTDETSHSFNGAALSLQAFVDDIPFQFNAKYRTIIVVCRLFKAKKMSLILFFKAKYRYS